jgi:hypothetical protein
MLDRSRLTKNPMPRAEPHGLRFFPSKHPSDTEPDRPIRIVDPPESVCERCPHAALPHAADRQGKGLRSSLVPEGATGSCLWPMDSRLLLSQGGRSARESPAADLIIRTFALLAANFNLLGRRVKSALTYSYCGGFSHGRGHRTGEYWNSPCFSPDNRWGSWETGSAGLRPPPGSQRKSR